MSAAPDRPAADPPAPGPSAGDAPAFDAIVPLQAGEALLKLEQVTMRFGGLVAVNALDLTVPAGRIFGLIGPNGAGKTTVFNMVTGVYRPTEGVIRFGGVQLKGLRPHRVTALGLARTFQNIRLFGNLTAEENVMVGADAHHRTGAVGAILGLRRHREEERDGRTLAADLLEFAGIAHAGQQLARNLPYGDQRRLEIARALATRPRLLLLDEPAAGMNPAEKQSLSDLIRRIRDTGVSVLLIEHDMSLVMTVCDRIAVLDFGTKIAEGLPAEIQSDPDVIKAYLGEPADAS